MRFTKERKIEMYHDRLTGIPFPVLAKKYNADLRHIKYTFCLIDMHGLDVVLGNNRFYSIEFKEEAIQRVLFGNESVSAVALELALINRTILFNWIRKYKENGYNVIKKKRGQRLMAKKPKVKIINKKETQEEKLKRIEQENEYLRAENEFLKKWNSVVQQIENQKKKE